MTQRLSSERSGRHQAALGFSATRDPAAEAPVCKQLDLLLPLLRSEDFLGQGGGGGGGYLRECAWRNVAKKNNK